MIQEEEGHCTTSYGHNPLDNTVDIAESIYFLRRNYSIWQNCKKNVDLVPPPLLPFVAKGCASFEKTFC
jgi:hypothetical protein